MPSPLFRGDVLVYVHVVWFGVWILLNTGHMGVPLSIHSIRTLDHVGRWKAIFLSTFVLISQNQLSEDIRTSRGPRFTHRLLTNMS